MTGGTQTGVRELVGEAVRDYHCTPSSVNSPVVCVGMVTWGAIMNKEALVSQDVRIPIFSLLSFNYQLSVVSLVIYCLLFFWNRI